ncbi:Isopentenyl-diphosphate delta-isomerase [uncultured Desulfobacterium sp.]|jgi:isopentenyl-diphosphate delta-isomerase|uniref:Isopentenyl-diphosphate delta-isomerase n=1 Tax=uncultured Desulfobacterium sp. TaxID=201089 RepID=A0A445MXS6_9BACT|nr:Isopentenyl-diphosphate delta-isomerase [uncultured Desulfobacterium sp.]
MILTERSSSDDKVKHLNICLEKDVESDLTTGFENYYFVNNPIPEIAFEDVDTSCKLLGKVISAPFIILPMTGGSDASVQINRSLAMAAQKLGLAMAVGSQRLGLEDPSLADSYKVRDIAPDIPLIANLGAIDLNYGYGLKHCERAVQMIGADGLSLYLNPMQKIVQGRGHLNFNGLIDKIAEICQHLSVPVIVKEIGFGMSSGSALLFKEAGVSILDVSGAGGTSWVKVSRHMCDNNLDRTFSCFDNWGIPTSDSLISVKKAVKDLHIIASGGIRNGIEIAKAIALGANYTGMALPLLAPAIKSSQAVEECIEAVIEQLKITMFCCGVSTLGQLTAKNCIIKR